MEKDKVIKDVIENVKSHLKEYLDEQGVKIDNKGFISCLHPSHPDKEPSCSLNWGNEFENRLFHCFSCLPGPQEVRTPNGLQEIWDLKKGDLVYSQYGIAKVVKTHRRKPKENTVEIIIDNVVNNNLLFTDNHPIKVVKNMESKVPYIKESKKGNKFMSGSVIIGGDKFNIVVFKNNYKEKENQPV